MTRYLFVQYHFPVRVGMKNSRAWTQQEMTLSWMVILIANLHGMRTNGNGNEMNHYVATVIVAPMTTKGRDYPTRVNCSLQGKDGQVVLDQIRTVDKSRLVHKIGEIDSKTKAKVLAVIAEIFAP